METTIKKVVTKADLKEFVRFPDGLYKDNPYYVPPLHNGELHTLGQNNPAFEYCEASYWLARRNGKTVGRIAGIINNRFNEEQGRKIARFGWLDFEEDQEVLQLLFQTFENWASEKGMEASQGPMGFISFDNSGVLVEGFEEIPTSFGHYNFPYYDPMIRKLGYLKDTDWVEFEVIMPDQVPERIVKAAELVEKRYKVRNAPLKSSKDFSKYADDFFRLLNVCYEGLYGFNQLTEKQIQAIKKEFLSVLQPDYVSMVINEAEELVGFGVAMPSLSKALQKAKGKLFPFGYYRVWKALRKNDTIDLLLLGIVPEYRNKGIHALIFKKIGESLAANGFKFLETTRELEDNHNITQLWSKLEHRQHKRARCYTKQLN